MEFFFNCHSLMMSERINEHVRKEVVEQRLTGYKIAVIVLEEHVPNLRHPIRHHRVVWRRTGKHLRRLRGVKHLREKIVPVYFVFWKFNTFHSITADFTCPVAAKSFN
ncbi:hypothetical protein LWI29_012951 [Acer saccharum]|uniref:Uncharacterized protein n=1 Tax=Acer saccharum TaxID=4024 RepID=A0AA39VID3_ACESA|nr:hypothetical protein LWI29_012951 [Acer saccharum]